MSNDFLLNITTEINSMKTRRLRTSQLDDLPGNRRQSVIVEHKSAITDQADRNNCIDWEGTNVIDRETATEMQDGLKRPYGLERPLQS